MQRHGQKGKSKSSVRLRPGVEALECRQVLSAPVPATTPVPDTAAATTNSMAEPQSQASVTPAVPRPIGATEVFKAHKVVAVHLRLLMDANLPPIGDTQQFSLETAGSKRHREARGPVQVPLASATYNQANRTVTLKPATPTPIRQYWVVTQAYVDGSDPPGGPVTWTTLVEPPNFRPGNASSGGSFPWAAFDPLVWPAMLIMR